jgi:tetratricopeptide (TPR) repeat protein
MEWFRQLDAVGRACTLVFLISLLCACLRGAPADVEDIKRAFEARRWEQVVEAAKSLSGASPEADYYLGIALARLERWEEASAALLDGQNLQPNDARFPIELAGVAFKQKRYSEATRWLRRGLRLNPRDPYAQDFLASIYFLQGNLEAALKYWNRAGKPLIVNVRPQPGLRVDPVLLDRAFTFAPGDVLAVSDLLTSRSRIEGLGIFPDFNFRLDVQDDGRFDASFTAQERNGWGNTKTEALVSTLRGVFYQTAYPDYFNVAHSAINVESLVRWDTQKRRLAVSLSGPLERDPQYRYWLGLDLRDENWATKRTFRTSAPSLAALKLRRYAVIGGVTLFRNGGWSWSAGGELSRRDYQNVAGSSSPADKLLQGYQLKFLLKANHDLLRAPERRFESSAHVSSELGTIWAASAHTFERLQASVDSRWMPRIAGDDFTIHQQFHAGTVFGKVPFDELFILGLERDNDLWMRAHIGTRDGRNGSAPMGLHYLLSNWEIDKNVYNGGLFSVKLSPFLDTGKIRDSALGLDTEKWLWDTGMQAKFRAFGVGVSFIYGKDLRSGSNTFYVIAARSRNSYR